MKRLIITTAIALALAAPAFASSTYVNDLGCDLKDANGVVHSVLLAMKEDHPASPGIAAHALMYQVLIGTNGVPDKQDGEPLWTATADANGGYFSRQDSPDWTLFLQAGTADGQGRIHAEFGRAEEQPFAIGVCKDFGHEITDLHNEHMQQKRDKFVYNGLNLIKNLAGIASAIHGH